MSKDMNEDTVTGLDNQIKNQITRIKSIRDRTPVANKAKERIRDRIENLRDRRNKITGNPKSEPVESVQNNRDFPDDMSCTDMDTVNYVSPRDNKGTKHNAIRKRKKLDEDFAPEVAQKDRHDVVKKIRDASAKIQKILDVESDKPHQKAYKTSINNMKKAISDLNDETFADDFTDDEMNEALTSSQRIKRAAQMRRNKARISIGRERAKKRIADKDRLKRRARRQARAKIVK